MVFCEMYGKIGLIKRIIERRIEPSAADVLAELRAAREALEKLT